MPSTKKRQQKREERLARKEEQDARNSQKNERNKARHYFVITLKLFKRDIPDITKDQIWDHIEGMPDFKEMILSQENIKLLPHQQESTFLIFLITKIDLYEEDVLEFMKPLLSGNPIADLVDHRRSFHCFPEIEIEGLINKNLPNTLALLTKVDFNCYFGAGLKRDNNVQSVLNLKHFHSKYSYFFYKISYF
jgi:hypothetical protein